MRFSLITLGCDKNTVDSERMMAERIEGDAEYIAVARTAAQALDIDGVTNLRGTVPVVPGSMVEVRIVDALDYDLVGEVRDASNSSTDS